MIQANVNAANAVFEDKQFDHNDGTPVFELEFTSNGNEYEYDIDAVTGKVLRAEYRVFGVQVGNQQSGTQGTTPPAGNSVNNYNDTDYGPYNDGVTDYNDTDYGPNNDGATDYNDTDYGPNNDGVTDYNAPAGDSGYDGDSGYENGDSGYDD